MNTMTLNALKAYKKIGVENDIPFADPQKLILMLFEGAQISIREAKQHMLDNEIAQKGISISKAITIIDNGLRASLDIDKGGEIAKNLHSLYEYMTHRLLIANIKSNPEILDEVFKLLSELHSAWASIGTPKTLHNTATDKHSPSADLITLSYGKV
jgi:flagellar protein FliS